MWELVKYSNGGHSDVWRWVSGPSRSLAEVAAWDRRQTFKRNRALGIIAGVIVALPVVLVILGSIIEANQPPPY